MFICSFFSRFILEMKKKAELLSCAHTLCRRQFDLIEQQIIYAIEINVRDFGAGCVYEDVVQPPPHSTIAPATATPNTQYNVQFAINENKHHLFRFGDNHIKFM